MQTSFFSGNKKFKIDKPIYLVEHFAGIGSQYKALKNISANIAKVNPIEFNEYQIKGYNAIHGTCHKTQDITTLKGNQLDIENQNKFCTIWSYSFPCQDLSGAGKGAGMAKGSGTRSGLLWEVERLLKEVKNLPNVLLMENVPEVIGQKNIKHFADWLAFLEKLGYKCYWQILNAKDYGIPQSRERCFMVSILGDYYYDFPQPIKLEKLSIDLCDDVVEEKYFITDKAFQGMLNTKFDTSKLENMIAKNGIIPTLCARDYKAPKLVMLGMLNDGVYSRMSESSRRVYDSNGLCPTLTTCGGGNLQAKMLIKEQLRKMTPKEYLRHMGFDDNDFNKIEKVLSNSRIYFAAGNSIVVNVLMELFKKMF